MQFCFGKFLLLIWGNKTTVGSLVDHISKKMRVQGPISNLYPVVAWSPEYHRRKTKNPNIEVLAKCERERF